MGNQVSQYSDLIDSDIVRRLAKKFSKLDIDKNGSLTAEELLSIPEIKQNPILKRVISVFDLDGNNEIDFKEFIDGLLIFTSKSDKQKRIEFIFKIYDLNNDGYISNGELYNSLKLMVGDNLKDHQLQQIVDKTILQLDQDGDGRISFNEFTQGVSTLAIFDKMNLELS